MNTSNTDRVGYLLCGFSPFRLRAPDDRCEQPRRVRLHRPRDPNELDYVDTPLTALVLGDERLRAPQALRDFLLCELRPLPRVPQHTRDGSVRAGVDRLHRARAPACNEAVSSIIPVPDYRKKGYHSRKTLMSLERKRAAMANRDDSG